MVFILDDTGEKEYIALSPAGKRELDMVAERPPHPRTFATGAEGSGYSYLMVPVATAWEILQE